VPNFAKIDQTVAVISRFFVIFKMATAAILDFQKEGQTKEEKTAEAKGA